MDKRIRQLTIDDYEDIIRVWADAGLPHKPSGRDSKRKIAAELKRRDTAFFGVYEYGHMAGVGLATYDGRKGWISRVAVTPDERGRGLAGQIISECETFLRSLGADVIACLIEDVNTVSMSLFQKHGFTCADGILYFSKRDSDES